MLVSIFEFADIINKEIVIRYYPNQNHRFTADFDESEIIEKGREHLLCGTYGNGKSFDEALLDYCKKISGQKIVFNAMNKERRQEFQIPILDHNFFGKRKGK